MALQSGLTVVRLPQLNLQCLRNRRMGLRFSSSQRVAALYNTFNSRKSFEVTTAHTLLNSIVRRSYATTRAVSRPKAHTGRTTTAARKAPTTSKTKAAKKPAVKKTAPKAIPKTKSKAKPRIKPKPKGVKKAKAKAKPKPKPKPKPKVLTEAEKTKKIIKDLKVVALSPPSGLPSTAWTVCSVETIKANVGTGSLAGSVKEASAKFKNLSPERLEHYNHIANQNKAANSTAYRKWIESHTPTVIHEANLARANLKRRKVKGYHTKLQDHRQVIGLRSAFALFSKDRHSTGDFKGLKISETGRLCSNEWKGLSATEKKRYQDASAADKERYIQERKTVYNKDVRPTATAASAA